MCLMGDFDFFEPHPFFHHINFHPTFVYLFSFLLHYSSYFSFFLQLLPALQARAHLHLTWARNWNIIPIFDSSPFVTWSWQLGISNLVSVREALVLYTKAGSVTRGPPPQVPESVFRLQSRFLKKMDCRAIANLLYGTMLTLINMFYSYTIFFLLFLTSLITYYFYVIIVSCLADWS